MIPLLYRKTLYILKALKHLLSHLIPVMCEDDSRAVILLYTQVRTGGSETLGTQGYMDAKCLLDLSNWTRLLELGYENFITVGLY